MTGAVTSGTRFTLDRTTWYQALDLAAGHATEDEAQQAWRTSWDDPLTDVLADVHTFASHPKGNGKTHPGTHPAGQ